MDRVPKDYIPLTEATYCILLSLLRPLHGYGIMQSVQEMSDGTIELGPGTLYGAVNKLLKEGLISRAKGLDEGERRKSYVLTNFGRNVLKAEYHRLSDLVRYGERVLAQMEGTEDAQEI